MLSKQLAWSIVTISICLPSSWAASPVQRPCLGIADYIYNLIVNLDSSKPQVACGNNSDGTLSTPLNILAQCVAGQSGVDGVSAMVKGAQGWCASSNNASVMTQSAKVYYSASVCCGNDTAAQSTAKCSTTRTLPATSEASCTFYLQEKGTGPGSFPGAGNYSAYMTSAQATSQPAATASPTQSSVAVTQSQESGTNTGLIIGAAVGASLGAVLLACVIAFAIWRRRQVQKRKRKSHPVSDGSESPLDKDNTADKAQLHSDDLKPDVKELPAAYVTPVRKVGDMQELDGSQHLAPWKVHELAGSDCDGRSELFSEDNSTVIGSAKT